MSELEERLGAIEARLLELEKHSHPPVDLTEPVREAMAAILERAAHDVKRRRK